VPQAAARAIAMRYALKALGEETIVVIPASCWSIVPGVFPHTAFKLTAYHVAFETAASTADRDQGRSGDEGRSRNLSHGLGSDGSAPSISGSRLCRVPQSETMISSTSAMIMRPYMNTGTQRSSATPYLAWTTTTPTSQPKMEAKKNIMEIMVAHQIPYAATACVAYPEDFYNKVRKAKEIKGLKFIHLLSTCPTGWRVASQFSIKVARLAVLTRIFPLYEVEDGERLTINVKPEFRPVRGLPERCRAASTISPMRTLK